MKRLILLLVVLSCCGVVDPLPEWVAYQPPGYDFPVLNQTNCDKGSFFIAGEQNPGVLKYRISEIKFKYDEGMPPEGTRLVILANGKPLYTTIDELGTCKATLVQEKGVVLLQVFSYGWCRVISTILTVDF